jgi:hypothetical protein
VRHRVHDIIDAEQAKNVGVPLTPLRTLPLKSERTLSRNRTTQVVGLQEQHRPLAHR